ncbi:MAG: phosphate ABC transporter substrate-binding protein [Acidobacteriota bacterium]
MRAAARGPRERAVALALALAVLAGCATTGRGELRLAGSDTMLPLTRALAQAFLAANPRLRVRVEGGGSTAGIAALIDGRADLCASSRPLTAAEAERLYRRHGRLGVRVQVARDALEVFVHPDNPVRELTMLQLKGIFTGRIRQWEKVGGSVGTIEVLIRPPSSGTHGFFRAVALDGEEYAPFATVIDTTEEVIELVAADETAIGYGGMAYGRGGVAVVALDGVPPSVATARSGAYPLSRYLYFITVGPPEGLARRFLDFSLSPAGQRVVAEAGFISLFED